jgi:transposase-like protein
VGRKKFLIKHLHNPLENGLPTILDLISRTFKRNKKDKYLKALAVLLYIFHGSFRKVSKELSLSFQSISKSAIHKLVKNFLERFSLAVEAKERNLIAVDETVVKVNGYRCFVWAAIDVETKELVAIYVSPGRSSLDAYFFLAKVKAKCKGKLPAIIVDKGPWYVDTLARLRFQRIHETFGRRNYVERLFRYLKERTKVFYNNIQGTFKCLELFIKLFALFYKSS